MSGLSPAEAAAAAGISRLPRFDSMRGCRRTGWATWPRISMRQQVEGEREKGRKGFSPSSGHIRTCFLTPLPSLPRHLARAKNPAAVSATRGQRNITPAQVLSFIRKCRTDAAAITVKNHLGGCQRKSRPQWPRFLLSCLVPVHTRRSPRGAVLPGMRAERSTRYVGSAGATSYSDCSGSVSLGTMSAS